MGELVFVGEDGVAEGVAALVAEEGDGATADVQGDVECVVVHLFEVRAGSEDVAAGCEVAECGLDLAAVWREGAAAEDVFYDCCECERRIFRVFCLRYSGAEPISRQCSEELVLLRGQPELGCRPLRPAVVRCFRDLRVGGGLGFGSHCFGGLRFAGGFCF